MVVWVAASTGWLVGFTDGDSALFIKGFRDKFFPQVRAEANGEAESGQ
jgi:hypothetical protein